VALCHSLTFKEIEMPDPAPNVRFTAADGTAKKVSDYLGQKLVLYFYPKDDTPGCTKEAQAFSALAGDFAKAGAVVVGISKDSEKSHAKFIGKYDLQLALGSDGDGSVCEAFGVWVEKSMYGKQYMGIERATFLIGADGNIAQIWRKVKVPGHAEAVLEATQALQ
jgi:thioredoxin-dependent peroxiredoxin